MKYKIKKTPQYRNIFIVIRDLHMQIHMHLGWDET